MTRCRMCGKEGKAEAAVRIPVNLMKHGCGQTMILDLDICKACANTLFYMERAHSRTRNMSTNGGTTVRLNRKSEN